MSLSLRVRWGVSHIAAINDRPNLHGPLLRQLPGAFPGGRLLPGSVARTDGHPDAPSDLRPPRPLLRPPRWIFRPPYHRRRRGDEAVRWDASRTWRLVLRAAPMLTSRSSFGRYRSGFDLSPTQARPQTARADIERGSSSHVDRSPHLGNAPAARPPTQTRAENDDATQAYFWMISPTASGRQARHPERTTTWSHQAKDASAEARTRKKPARRREPRPAHRLRQVGGRSPR